MKELPPAPERMQLIDIGEKIVGMQSFNDARLLVFTETDTWEVGVWPFTYAVRLGNFDDNPLGSR